MAAAEAVLDEVIAHREQVPLSPGANGPTAGRPMREMMTRLGVCHVVQQVGRDGLAVPHP